MLDCSVQGQPLLTKSNQELFKSKFNYFYKTISLPQRRKLIKKKKTVIIQAHGEIFPSSKGLILTMCCIAKICTAL